ncbi:MAG: tetratricopeptide repeat protein [Nitrospirota bacterium]
MKQFLQQITIIILIGVFSVTFAADSHKKDHNKKNVQSDAVIHKKPTSPNKNHQKALHQETPKIRVVVLPPSPKPIKPLEKKKPKQAGPVFSRLMSEKNEAAMREPLKAYRAGNLDLAIKKAKKLLKGDRYNAEVAAYFIGDFYEKQYDAGEKTALAFAMTSLQEAVKKYPYSELATFGYYRVGEIYTRQKLYYEAIGSFQKIVDDGIDEAFMLRAKIGIAKVYQAWGRWYEAKEQYDQLLRSVPPMPAEERAIVLFGYADTVYQMGQFNEALSAYKKLAVADPTYRYKNQLALFQYGEAAFRAQQFNDAKAALLDFYNIYPKDSLAAVALVRIETIINLEKKSKPHIVIVTPNIPSVSDTLHRYAVSAGRISKDDPAFNLGRILLAMNALKKCRQTIPPSPKKGLKAPSSCDPTLEQEAFHVPSKTNMTLEEKIKTDVLDYLTHIPPSTTAQGIILEAIYQLKKDQNVEKVIEMEAMLLVNLPSMSPYRKEVQETLHETITTQFKTINDPGKVVTLFHSYPEAFTKEMLRTEIGYMIAMSHVKTGLYSKAIHLLKPISENFRFPLWEEALYQKGKSLVAIGDYGNAQQALEMYQRISLDREKAYADLGDLHFKRGDVTQTITAYEKWLSHFTKDSNRPDIFLKLSEAYRYRSDYDNEIKVYARWIGEGVGKLDLPSMRLADTYFQMGEHKKAISSYRAILENKKGGEKEMEWARLRLATSYELTGQDAEGRKYFKNISQDTKNGLIRELAKGKTSPF